LFSVHYGGFSFLSSTFDRLTDVYRRYSQRLQPDMGPATRTIREAYSVLVAKYLPIRITDEKATSRDVFGLHFSDSSTIRPRGLQRCLRATHSRFSSCCTAVIFGRRFHAALQSAQHWFRSSKLSAMILH
jgi:hypothetical protein